MDAGSSPAPAYTICPSRQPAACSALFDICKRHELCGAAALKDKVGGRKLGEDRLLTAEQERQIQRLIQDKTPDQIKLPYALWSRQAVADLILDQFGITVAVRTMGTYLKRWGFTPQKPLRRAYEQSPAAVKQWMDTAYRTQTQASA